jgi:tetratricopeptide (TPR) repeat protein
MSHSTFRPFIILALILMWSNALQAQRSDRPVSAEVHGQVRIAHGGSSADEVLVRLESFKGGLVGEVRTDRLGKFRFSGLVPDQYIVTVHAPGFKDTQQQVDLQTTTSEYVQLQLVPDKPLPSNAEAGSTKLINANVPAEARKEFEKSEAVLSAGETKQNLEEAVRHLDKAVSLYPNFFEAQLELGTLYMDMQQWEKAEQALHRAIEINSRSSNALFALGEVYRRQKRYAEAERSLQEGLKLDDKSPLGHFTLGRVYWDKGELAKAGPQVGQALQLKPDYAEAHLLAGNILLRARQPENALTEFEEYLRLAPKGEFASQARELANKIKRALDTKK